MNITETFDKKTGTKLKDGRLKSAFVRGFKQIFRYALIGVGIFIIFIVNNGNILTDGRRYRKRPPRIDVKKNTKIN